MVSEMKLIISENNKVIHTLTKEIHPNSLVKSIEDFQQAANAKLTKMIEELCGNDSIGEDDDDATDDDDEEEIIVKPKKRKLCKYKY